MRCRTELTISARRKSIAAKEAGTAGRAQRRHTQSTDSNSNSTLTSLHPPCVVVRMASMMGFMTALLMR
jgi:hypothetical protein